VTNDAGPVIRRESQVQGLLKSARSSQRPALFAGDPGRPGRFSARGLGAGGTPGAQEVQRDTAVERARREQVRARRRMGQRPLETRRGLIRQVRSLGPGGSPRARPERSQVPPAERHAGRCAASLTVSSPAPQAAAWKTLPSWAVVATSDKAIPPDGERHMAKRAGAQMIELDASHSIALSQPAVVAELIRTAVAATSAAPSPRLAAAAQTPPRVPRAPEERGALSRS
jgi:hypothetical protein